MNAPQKALLGAIRIYQALASPVLAALFGPSGLGCRFEPTCSHYAAQSIITHGALRGTFLAARRLCRCHPFGGSGLDPVPPVQPRRAKRRFSLPGRSPHLS